MEGLLIAMRDLDKIVSTIRAAKDGTAAAVQLQKQFGLSPEQVPALKTHVPTVLSSVILLLVSYAWWLAEQGNMYALVV